MLDMVIYIACQHWRSKDSVTTLSTNKIISKCLMKSRVPIRNRQRLGSSLNRSAKPVKHFSG